MKNYILALVLIVITGCLFGCMDKHIQPESQHEFTIKNPDKLRERIVNYIEKYRPTPDEFSRIVLQSNPTSRFSKHDAECYQVFGGMKNPPELPRVYKDKPTPPCSSYRYDVPGTVFSLSNKIIILIYDSSNNLIYATAYGDIPLP